MPTATCFLQLRSFILGQKSMLKNVAWASARAPQQLVRAKAHSTKCDNFSVQFHLGAIGRFG